MRPVIWPGSHSFAKGYAKTLLLQSMRLETIEKERVFYFKELAMNRFCKSALLCLGAAVLAGSALAQSVTVADVPYEQVTALHGSALLLNGAGVRYKTVFKVYTAGLYLEKKAHTTAAVTALNGPKRLVLTMLREIDSRELGKLFARGMEENLDKAAFSRLIPGVLRMGQIFSDHKNLQAGDPVMIDWIPGAGTVITVKGKVQGEPFKEPEFFHALLGIWLGEHPADWKLKEALLGKPV